jgi:hypothetical protein
MRQVLKLEAESDGGGADHDMTMDGADSNDENRAIDATRNVPFNAYTVGSYFGDCDLFPEM